MITVNVEWTQDSHTFQFPIDVMATVKIWENDEKKFKNTKKILEN
jgi:hypothetical protein